MKAAEAVAGVARQHAIEVDSDARFPEATIRAARELGLLGLVSSEEVGGKGAGLDAAAHVVERLARECASSAMVMTMHYSGAFVIEEHGDETARRAVASGQHLSTLAFSESGSRSHFWAPTSSAKVEGDEVILDADKSWITSARHADAYVWSSRPANAEGMSTLWLVPRNTEGVEKSGGFNGIGLRGNDSAPVTAWGARIPMNQRLGEDGRGFDVMMGTVLPRFSIMIAAGSIGMAEAAVQATAEHAGGVKYAHLEQMTLAELPTIRAYVAKMKIRTDEARMLWEDAIRAVESGREDAMLRVLEVKASAAEAASAVLDTAMRVCGGQAFRKDVGVERRFRDARASMVMAPTTDQLYDFIGKAVCGLPLF
ncbi:Acryloyl-CoA reductase (NADH) [Planctomycetes bacterium Poly30]|uniref:Acryloyl-CoA reductase (NADH) n=2 Tax=Saltatorellus ferox TaxID=2528018 RepID=A0A518ENE1_9BACT|nr:Acryloyl-CoA reductase (NADH) [Planctomycetes bacterium Poly30]